MTTAPDAEDIVIAAANCVTPLGLSLDATWEALLAGRFVVDQGVAPIERDGLSRVAQLALLAAGPVVDDREVALFVGTSKGPADEWLKSGRVGEAGIAELSDDIARELRLVGDRATCSAACASGAHALAIAAMRLRAGLIDRALVVASESSLDRIWSQNFKRLGVLARPGEPCRPFDEERHGFVISEAAAAIRLERRPARPGEIMLASATIASDAFHLTGGDPDARTLRHLLAISSSTVDLIHAHATATGSDAIELGAIAGSAHRDAIIYSHKGSLGHTLGASGLVAAALTTRMLRDGVAPAMPTLSRSIDPRVSPDAKRRELRSAICLASGFGGTAASFALGRVA